MSEGVVESTVDEAKRHPWLIVGGFVALVLVIYLASGKKATPAFRFSYGPSDAQVLAGTQLAIAQAQDQTKVSLMGQLAGVYHDYFGYLATNSANTLDAYKAQDAANVLMNAQNNQAATAQSESHDYTTGVLATINANAAVQGYAYQLQQTQNNNAAAVQINAQTVQAQTAQVESTNFTQGVVATINANSADYIAGFRR